MNINSFRCNIISGAFLTPVLASAHESASSADRITLRKQPVPLAGASALAGVRLPGKDLPAVVPLSHDRNERTLHDDGQAGDQAAGDGIYSAVVPGHAATLTRLTAMARKQETLLTDGQKFRRSGCDSGIMWGPGSAAVSSGLDPSATAALFQNGKSGLRQDERPLEDGGAPGLAGLMPT